MRTTMTTNKRYPGARPVADVSHPLSWAIYGRSGTGKTTFASTFPTPILLLDVKDQGTDSIADIEDIDVMEIEEWDDFEDAYYYLAKHKKTYKTVVIDTVSQLQQLNMEHVLSKKRKKVESIGDWGTMTRREWGDVAGMMKEWITDYRDLPLEVVFIAQDRVNKGEDEEDSDMLLPEVGPRLMPSVASHLNAAVSVIGNTFIKLKRVKKEVRGKIIKRERAVYSLRLGPHPIYTTKIRKPKSVEAPPDIEDPTYDDVIDIIKGEV